MKDLDAIDETVERFEHSAEFERTHGNLMGCQEFKQLAEWLRELKEYKEQESCDSCCGGDQKEKAKLCQKSHLAGLEHRQEPCEDAISREDALLALTGVNLLSKKPEELISLFDKRIKALPSVAQK